MLASNIRDHFHARLTITAGEEFEILRSCLGAVSLSEASDARHMFSQPDKLFASKHVPRALQSELQKNPDTERVWKTKLPTRVCFFAWLLHHGRLNTRAHLHHRNIRQLDEWFCEVCVTTPETDSHTFSGCPPALGTWGLLGIQPHPHDCRHPWLVGRELQLPGTVLLDVILLILWHIWKALNGVIFDHKHSTPTDILRRVTNDMAQWRVRYKKNRQHWDVWLSFISSKL